MKKWKKQIRLIFSVFVMLVLIGSMSVLSAEASSDSATKVPTKITLNYKKKNVSVGDTFSLKVKKVKPKGASKQVVWSSTNKKIATVSAKGKVKVNWVLPSRLETEISSPWLHTMVFTM